MHLGTISVRNFQGQRQINCVAGAHVQDGRGSAQCAGSRCSATAWLFMKAKLHRCAGSGCTQGCCRFEYGIGIENFQRYSRRRCYRSHTWKRLNADNRIIRLGCAGNAFLRRGTDRGLNQRRSDKFPPESLRINREPACVRKNSYSERGEGRLQRWARTTKFKCSISAAGFKIRRELWHQSDTTE